MGLSIRSDAKYVMTGNTALTVSSFNNEGTFVPGNGRVVFAYDNNNYLNSRNGVCTFYDLIIWDGDVSIYEGPISVQHLFALSAGSVYLEDNAVFTVGLGGTITSQLGPFDADHCIYSTPCGSEESGYFCRYVEQLNGEILFPVGTFTSGRIYSPVVMTYQAEQLADNAYIKVKPVAGKHPSNPSQDNYLRRYWKVFGEGFSDMSAVVTCQYDPSDVTGNENNLWGGKTEPQGTWTRLGLVDPFKHLITGTITNFGDFTAGEFDAMPVELTSFTVLYDGEANILNWTTATETNNYGFEIERASSRQVGTTPRQGEWEIIGFIEGNNTSTEKHEYQFVDKNIQDRVYFYRLRQIDLDGTATYSNTVKVETGNVPKGFVLYQNYPNPFNPKTIISFGSSKKTKAKLVIFNQLGQELETIFNGIIEANEIKKINFDASDYAGGVYFYKLITPEWTSTKKMVLLK
jgi:hypothetical protein